MFYCSVCGKPFKAEAGAVTCSDECFEKLRKMHLTEERHCNVCGKMYIPKTFRQSTCSLDCGSKRRSVIKSDVLPIKTCEVCGKQYKPTRPEQRVCSVECIRFLNKNYRTGKCAVCGAPYERKNNSKTCSKECSQIYRNKPKKKKPRVSPLVEVVRQANAAGMSYGKYMVYLKNKSEGIA